MPVLRDLQRDFWQAIAAEPGDCTPSTALLAAVQPSAVLDPTARLRIYADAYFWRLHQVLQETFPRVVEHTGAEAFRQLTADYLRLHPSQHPSIGYIGARFSEFLDQRGGAPAYLGDLARLEWAQVVAFEAASATPLTTDALRGVAPQDWPQLRFHTVPSLHVVDLHYPVHQLWRDGEARLDQPQTLQLRVWRRTDFQVLHSVLDAREAQALHSLRAGGDFATICEAFVDLPEDEAAQQAIALLVRWLDDQILTANM